MNHSRMQRRARSTYFLTLTSILRGTKTAEDRPLALLCVVEERARCMTLISLANRSTFARVGSPYPLVQLKMEAVGENLARRFGLQSEQMTANRLLHHRSTEDSCHIVPEMAQSPTLVKMASASFPSVYSPARRPILCDADFHVESPVSLMSVVCRPRATFTSV